VGKCGYAKLARREDTCSKSPATRSGSFDFDRNRLSRTIVSQRPLVVLPIAYGLADLRCATSSIGLWRSASCIHERLDLALSRELPRQSRTRPTVRIAILFPLPAFRPGEAQERAHQSFLIVAPAFVPS